MSIFSDQFALGSALLSGIVIMIFGEFVFNKIREICATCKHKNSAMAVRNSK